jgi:hypothetical protein
VTHIPDSPIKSQTHWQLPSIPYKLPPDILNNEAKTVRTGTNVPLTQAGPCKSFHIDKSNYIFSNLDQIQTIFELCNQRCLQYSATNNPAMPIPEPTHILVSPTFLPVRLSSVNKVDICLAPVVPKGCPNAIAPPLGFTFSIGIFKC